MTEKNPVRKVRTNHLRLLIWLLLLLSASAVLAQQSTSFTYQGRLQDTGTPANGSYDLQFTLFDSGGTQIGSPLVRNAVAVANGIFTVQLDFFASAFPGADRFLEIGVRPAGGGSFTILSPRQQTTATPYAIHTLNASAADTLSSACAGCVQDSNINTVAGSKVNGAIPVASVPSGSANYIQNTTTQQATSNLNISGNGTAGGTISGSVVNANTQFNIGGSRVVSIAGDQNTFVGFAAGRDNTNGGGNAFFGFGAGRNNTAASQNSFFGVDAGQANAGANNAFFGALAGVSNISGSSNTLIGLEADVGTSNLTNATAIGANAFVSSNNSLVLGSIDGINLATASTNVGIGTTAPVSQLHVRGASPVRILGDTTTLSGSESVDFMARSSQFASDLGGMRIQRQVSGHAGNIDTLFFAAAAGSSATERMRITGNGYVGIGTNMPTDKLHIVTTTNGPGFTISDGVSKLGAFIGTDGSGDYGAFFGTTTSHPLIFFANNFQAVIIDTSKNMFPAFDNNQSLGKSTNRWSAVWAVNGTIQTSDARLKKTITNLGYGLSQVMQLRPVTFQWRDRNDGRTHLGLIAQEVENIIPEAVERDKDPATPLGMNYTSLVPVLIKAIQEQQITLSTLQAENAALNARLAGLEKTVDKDLALARQRHSRLRVVKHVVSTGNSTPSRSRAGSGLAAQN